MRKQRSRLQVEQLEDRSCPASLTAGVSNSHLIIEGDPAGTLAVRQVGDSFRVRDGNKTLGTFDVSGDIRIRLEGDNDVVAMHFTATGAPGNVRVILGDGNNKLRINPQSAGGLIAGSLIIRGGAGLDEVKIGSQLINPLSVAGALKIATAGGSDTVQIRDGTQVGGLLDLTGVNRFILGGNASTDTIVEGDVKIDVSSEDLTSTYFFGRNTDLQGKLDYAGSNGADHIDVLGTIGGNTTFSLKSGHNTFELAPTAIVEGNLNLFGRSGNDFFVLYVGSEVAGNLAVDAGAGDDTLRLLGAVNGNALVNLGDGTNLFVFQGTVGGNRLEYRGGSGTDTVNYSGNATFADVKAVLGGGNDLFKVTSRVFASANLDGGTGTDTLQILVAFTFPITSVNSVNFEN
jgi:hypothetical protein